MSVFTFQGLAGYQPPAEQWGGGGVGAAGGKRPMFGGPAQHQAFTRSTRIMMVNMIAMRNVPRVPVRQRRRQRPAVSRAPGGGRPTADPCTALVVGVALTNFPLVAHEAQPAPRRGRPQQSVAEPVSVSERRAWLRWLVN